MRGSSADEARSFLNLYPANEMVGQAAPLPPRKPASEVQNPLFDLASICYLMAMMGAIIGSRKKGHN
jgi:hypothetical protein